MLGRTVGTTLYRGSCCGLLRAAASSRHVVRTQLAAAASAAPAAAAPSVLDTQQDVQAPAFRAFVDFKFVKDNVELVKQNCANRLSNANPEKVAALYDEWVRLGIETDRIRAERNENSKAMKGKLDAEQREALVAKGQALKVELERIESELERVERLLQFEGQRLPNLTHPDVPCGGEDAARVVAMVGAPRQFEFEPRNHVDIAETLDLIDFDRAAQVSGSKFYYFKNAAALLEMALCSWAMHKVVAKGFTPLTTPDLVRAAVLEKCGFQPRASNTQVYSIEDSELCLTGTAEVPLGGVYMDDILDESQLPIRMCAFGHCFRTEAGASGLAGKGLYRVHQFSKVEMFVLCTPQQSNALHEELIAIEREMFEELGLHFKVLDMPSGDLGAPAYRKYDVEAWMPGLQRYGEISSASNCTDYQSRRLNIRYRQKETAAADNGAKGKKKAKKAPTAFVHTLNATACAVPRMIICILENFQQADGSIVVPPPLRPYMAGMAVICPPQPPPQ